jgi:hypothetical protein
LRTLLLLIIVLLINYISFAQTEYVSIDNSVYEFLERMETLQIIPDYNSFEIPKTRKQISYYLKAIDSQKQKLDKADIGMLEDFKTEFEFDMYSSLKKSLTLIGNDDYDFLSQKQKYFFYYNEAGKANIFINLTGEGQFLLNNNQNFNTSASAFLGIIGGEIRGTFINKFGFFIKGTNGKVFGKREAALLRPELKYNYKLNENPDETFFDDTEGYLTADFDLVRLKYGRDRMNIGYGVNKIIMGNIEPKFDYLALNLNYKFFTYSFFHGQLLGQETLVSDSVTGGVHSLTSKYIAYHRIGFNISKAVNFGAGEVIIYGDRSIDLSYFNPFSFYKSVEHSNRDRDNAMLFFDFNNKSIRGIKLYVSLLIDDITFGKLGTGWWGNQTILDAGIYSELLYPVLPLGIKLQYTKIDPYVYTHRLIRNNFTSFGYSISSFTNPNSETFLTQFNYRINNRMEANFTFDYQIHGANILNPDGTIQENVGGDIALGHRLSDSENIKFLDGYKEYSRLFSLELSYEPYNEYYLIFNFNYTNESLQTVHNKSLGTAFTLKVKI